MEVVRGLINIKERHLGGVITIGNFDGVHLGHQKILSEVVRNARALSTHSMLICFEPQPRELFDRQEAPARLTRFREKVELLSEHGIDVVLCIKFNELTRSMSAERFLEVIAVDLAIKSIFIGDDFRFGQDRSGNFEKMVAAGNQYGFEVHDMNTIVLDDTRISSTFIRERLAEGDFELATKLMGHPYSIIGKVIYGNQVGRTIGVPTANIQLQRYVAPIAGVFACRMEVGAKSYNGVANIGVRPTVDDNMLKPILEVHLFDFDGDIYGETAKVTFLHKIREEKKFPDLDALSEAITADIQEARRLLKVDS